MYQQINISDHSLVGSPGAVPSIFSGWTDASLADISSAVSPAPSGFAGQGFWPVGAVTTPTFDPTTQSLDGTATYTANVSTQTVTGVANLRAATASEASAALAALRQTRVAELDAACSAQITGGYQSSALGAPHTYPSGITDQINMMGSVTASLLPDGQVSGWTTPFWCADSSGAWSYQMHTASQIQTAGRDGKVAVAAAQTKLATLSAQIAAATTRDQIQAIVW